MFNVFSARWSRLAGVGALALLLLSACEKSDHAAKPVAQTPSKPVIYVDLVQPKPKSVQGGVKLSGNIEPWQEAVIGAQLNGFALAEVLVDVGDVVQKGQLLARLSADTLAAELNQLQAGVEEAKVAYQEAKANADRARQVDGSGALSQQQVAQYLALEQSGKARLAAAQAAWAAQQVRLGQTRIVAPDSGVISAKRASLGAVVAPGEELFRLLRQQRLEWRAQLGIRELSMVKKGQKARVQLQDGVVLEGVVRTVSPKVDAQTRYAVAYVDLPQAKTAFAGSTVSGELILNEHIGLLLPQTAVLVRDGGHWVFEMGADHKVAARKVTLGARLGDEVEVFGLRETAQLVKSGVGFLNDGDVVAPAR